MAELTQTYGGMVKEAREAEAAQETESAVKLYRRAIKKDPYQELPYDRLMIIYRKQKQYEEERSLIQLGIRTFERFYQERAGRLLQKSKSANKLSTALARSLGQSDKKGTLVYPEPIPKWLRRLTVVEKRLGLQ